MVQCLVVRAEYQRSLGVAGQRRGGYPAYQAELVRAIQKDLVRGPGQEHQGVRVKALGRQQTQAQGLRQAGVGTGSLRESSHGA